MIRSLLFLLLFIPAFLAQGQRNFRLGYIIQNADTLKGYINYRSHKANASACQFKATLNSAIQTFKASEINGYGFSEGIHFQSRSIQESLKVLPNKKKTFNFFFLNQLVSGKADLYYVRDITGKDRYFIQKDTVFKELESEVIRVEDRKTGTVYQGVSKQYIGTMNYLLNDCKTLQPTINTTKFGQVSLTKTLLAYNQCVHPDSLYFAQKPKKPETTFGFTLGPVFTHINLQRWGATGSATTKNRNSGYFAGITMNNTLPFLNEKLSIQTELLMVRNHFDLETTYSQQQYGGRPNDLIFYHLKGKVTRYTLKIPLQLRYTFNFRKLQPYLSGGLIITKNMKATDSGTLSAEYNQEQKSITYQGFYPRPLHGNITTATGILYKLQKNQAVFIELKYVPEGILNLYGFSSEVNSWMLSTGFRF